MNSPLRNFLLSAVLIAVPAGGFAMAETYILPPAQTADAAPVLSGLGDLGAYKTIVADTQTIAATGDFAAAEQHITDFETLWDQNATALRRADKIAWNAVDAAADEAFSALRSGKPEKAAVDTALAKLSSTLDAPVPAAASGTIQYASGIAVTDESGRALPCEELIGQLRDAIGTTTPTAEVASLQTNALERCNADDDTHADAFSARAIALIKG